MTSLPITSTFLCEHDEVNVRRIGLGLSQQRLRRFRGHVRRGRAPFGDMPFPDAGSRANPFVAGFNDFLEVRIGHHLRRNVAGYTRNLCRDAVRHDSPCELLPGAKESEFYAIARWRYKAQRGPFQNRRRQLNLTKKSRLVELLGAPCAVTEGGGPGRNVRSL